jgi:tRNA threonylcarbamoyl adenosine modification protein (Sua5/YciO/YrdC/YwlC family)
MKTIKIWNGNISDRQLNEIAARLDAGELVILPTDTAYAVTCDALNIKSIDRICRMKGINPDKTNLSILCSDISMAAEYCRISNSHFRMLKENTPGPFTFIFRSASSLPKAFKGRKTVGIRIPDNRLTLAVVERFGRPLLTTTIEYADEDYAVNPELISESYEGRADMMVEGGNGSTDVSTIVDCTENTPEITREGLGELL